MKYSLTSLAMLSLYATHALALPIANIEERNEDCYMEWITVYGDASTGSSASPTVSTAVLSGVGKPIMRHSYLSNSIAAVSAESTGSATMGAMQTNSPVEVAKQNVAAAKPASISDAESSITSPSATISPSTIVSSSAAGPTPGGKKAGISGFQGVTAQAGWTKFSNKISWYSDYTPNPADSGSIKGIGMLWGDGSQGLQDASRLATFTSIVAKQTPAPEYMMGFYEPDFTPPDSSAIDSTTAASDWAKWLAPLGAKGTKLGSPSLAKQLDEDWLTPFENASEKPTWDFTSIHANKNSSTLVKADVEYYYNKYKKPVWVSEFSCVNDLSWTLCDDPTTFIKETVAYLEGSDMVVAYGYSNGDGLPESWKIFDGSGALSANGQTYLAALGG